MFISGLLSMIRLLKTLQNLTPSINWGGNKEENMKTEVHKNLEGTFVLSQMQPEHD
jgi:hypothetical protein